MSLTGTPLFNQLSTSARTSMMGAFSLKAISGVTSKVIQVTNGVAVKDFYADRTGRLLDVPVTGQTLRRWLGGVTGNVVTWYDQSGRGNHMTCSSAEDRPTVVLGDDGNYYIQSGNSTSFDISANPTSGPVPYSNAKGFTVIWHHKTLADNTDVCSCTDSSNTTRFGIAGGSYASFFPIPGSLQSGSLYAEGDTVTCTFDGTNRRMYTNGILNGTQASTWLQDASTAHLVGSPGTDCRLYSVVMFDSVLPESDQTLVENLPPPPPAVTGFVASNPTTTTIDLDWNASSSATLYTIASEGTKSLTGKSVYLFGLSSAMSEDGNTIVVTGFGSMETPIVYRLSAGLWDTGTALTGQSVTNFGFSTAMSSDGSTIVVTGRDSMATPIVYRLSAGLWDTGTALTGQSVTNFGFSTAMSSDGNTIVVTGQGSMETPFVYRFSAGSWDTGTALTGQSVVYFGQSSAMSADGNTIVVTGGSNDTTPIVYRFSAGLWDTGTALAGKNINGFGQSSAMSADGNTIVVTGVGSMETPFVYRFSAGSWDTGTALTGQSVDGFGQSSAMSSDGNTIVVTGQGSMATPIVYRFSAGLWDTGTALTGKSVDGFGWSSAMSSDGNTIVVTGLGSMVTPIVYDLQTQTTSTVPPPPFTFTGLRMGAEYTFVITPSNAAGNGPSTTSDPISTILPLPGDAPAMVANPTIVTATTMNLAWNEYVPEYATSFNVYAYSVIDGLIGFVNVPISSFSCTYTGLQPGTEYYFTVAGVNETGAGPQNGDPTVYTYTLSSLPYYMTYTGAIETISLAPGTYNFEMAGGSGPSYNFGVGQFSGARSYGTFGYTVTSPITIEYAIGQASPGQIGGGGGTFVYDVTNSQFLFVAGGAGGGFPSPSPYDVGNGIPTDPGDGSGGAAGSGGGSGAGVNSNGSDSTVSAGSGGITFGNGATGGAGGSFGEPQLGGFGGGGGGTRVYDDGLPYQYAYYPGGGSGYTGGTTSTYYEPGVAASFNSTAGTSYMISGSTFSSWQVLSNGPSQDGYLNIIIP